MMRLPLANWLPDVTTLSNPGQSEGRNVYATGSGYGPLRSLNVVSSTGLNAKARGAASAQGNDGAVVSFAGDASKLYKLSGNAYSDVSVSGGYTLGDDEHWEFAQFGARVLATQIGDPIQYFDIGSSTLFANLAGSPPQARHIAIVRDFVVVGNTTTSPKELAWSGLNDSTTWTAGVKQSDSQILPDNGEIQAITGGEVGMVFQERAITRMTFVGPPLYFQLDAIEEKRGTDIPGSVIKVGPLVYFHSPDGFFVNAAGISQPIGDQKVDKWFASHIEPGTEHLVTSGYDPTKSLVVWSFVSTDATDATNPDTLLMFNWKTQQFTYGKLVHELISNTLTNAWTLEQVGSSYPNLETVPASLDSPIWNGGASYLGGFNTSHQLGTFSGTTLEGLVQTSDFEGVPGRRAVVTNVRPICDADEITAYCRSRERFADALVNTETSSLQSNGDIPLLSSGRFFQVAMTIPAGSDWTFINQVDVDAQDDGEI